jgi:hypothetical protein
VDALQANWSSVQIDPLGVFPSIMTDGAELGVFVGPSSAGSVRFFRTTGPTCW